MPAAFARGNAKKGHNFVRTNVQLSITANKSNFCNKSLVYMPNVPWKSLTAANKQEWWGSRFQSISLNRIHNGNWSFPPPKKKTRKSWSYFGAEIARKVPKLLPNGALCLNWVDTCRICLHYSEYHRLCDQIHALFPFNCALCRRMHYFKNVCCCA